VRRYHLHRKARADYRQALEYYRGEGDDVMYAFAIAVRTAIDAILSFPLSSPADRLGVRRKPLRGYPYTIFYSEEDELIEILAFAHQRRSDYWRERL
jgi:toxin ParE1/3/4